MKLSEHSQAILKQAEKEISEDMGVSVTLSFHSVHDYKERYMKVIDIFCSTLGMDTERFLLNHKSRKREYINIRMQIAQYLHVDMGFTLTYVAEILKKDHTTIINALKKFKDYMETYSEFAYDYNRASKEIKKTMNISQVMDEIVTI